MAKKQSKSEKIRILLSKGVAPSEIVKRLKVSNQLVYIVRSNANKKAKGVARVAIKKSKQSGTKTEVLVLGRKLLNLIERLA